MPQIVEIAIFFFFFQKSVKPTFPCMKYFSKKELIRAFHFRQIKSHILHLTV